MKIVDIILYTTDTGKQPFAEWQKKLTTKTESIVLARLARIAILHKQSGIGLILRSKNMAKKRIYKNYNELLQERLKNPKLAMAYLNEALQDEDQNVFLIALKDVLEAQGEDVSALAKKAHISRQSCYRMLSKKGNPRWNNITSLIDAMGLQVQLTYK